MAQMTKDTLDTLTTKFDIKGLKAIFSVYYPLSHIESPCKTLMVSIFYKKVGKPNAGDINNELKYILESDIDAEIGANGPHPGRFRKPLTNVPNRLFYKPFMRPAYPGLKQYLTNLGIDHEVEPTAQESLRAARISI